MARSRKGRNTRGGTADHSALQKNQKYTTMKTQPESQEPTIRNRDENRDALTGEPGAHPVGTGLGAAGGATAGAALGAAAGPIGAAVGLVAGAVAGGLTGTAIAELIDPTAEDAYWRENYSSRPYVETNASYQAYAPSYRIGYEGRARYPGRSFEEAEAELERDYEDSRGNSPLTWVQAKQATRDAWHRAERNLPGDADGDGR